MVGADFSTGGNEGNEVWQRKVAGRIFISFVRFCSSSFSDAIVSSFRAVQLPTG
jgi:hypothetical protein